MHIGELLRLESWQADVLEEEEPAAEEKGLRDVPMHCGPGHSALHIRVSLRRQGGDSARLSLVEPGSEERQR